MKFSQFCDMAENTEQEQQLFQLLKKDEMKEFSQIMEKMSTIPIVGGIFAAIFALSKSESIAEFKQSEHYRHIMDCSFKVNFDTGSLYVGPSDVQKKKMVKVLAVICIVVTALIIYRKLRCCRKGYEHRWSC
jgi:hypothetical protein